MWTYLLIACLLLLLALYVGALFYLRRGLEHSFLNDPNNAYRPFVSVVISAHNEAKNLPDCLRLLAEQDYPAERVEFIIVNDRSSDATASIIREQAEHDRRFKSISISGRLNGFAPKKRAIDTAIRRARGDIILLTDADGRPGPQWISGMVRYFTPDTDMVIGYAPYKVKPAHHFVKKLLALEYRSHAAVACATAGLGFPVTCVGTNMAYRKSLYLEIDGFGPYKGHLSGDDDLFLTHVRESGHNGIQYATDERTHVYNNPPRLWRRFMHQRIRYASKGFDYPANVTIGLLALYLFNVGLLGGLLSWGRPILFFAALTVFAVKAGGEYLFMNEASRVLGDRRFLHFFPIAAVLHIPYVVLFGMLGQVKQYRWAGATRPASEVETLRQEIS